MRFAVAASDSSDRTAPRPLIFLLALRARAARTLLSGPAGLSGG